MDHVYNCDETGLNFKTFPSKGLVSQNEVCARGYKLSKECLTVLACNNVTGTNKMPLMVIGKSAKPRVFKNVNMNLLPVYYKNQNKAWMNAQLFKEWFYKQFVPTIKIYSEKNGLPIDCLLYTSRCV